MAVRQRRDNELGPAVPRWVVEFDPARWGDSNEGYGAWQRTVFDWADANLSPTEHLGAWMDVVSNALRMRGH